MKVIGDYHPTLLCSKKYRIPAFAPLYIYAVHIYIQYINNQIYIYIHYTYARHIVLLQAMFLFLLWSLRRCRLHLYYSCFLVVSPCFACRSVQLTYSDPPCEHGFPNIWLKMNQVTCFYGSLWRVSPYPAIKRGWKFPIYGGFSQQPSKPLLVDD